MKPGKSSSQPLEGGTCSYRNLSISNTSVNQRSLNDTKMNKEQSRQELQLVVSQALMLFIRLIYSPSVS
jgi:hypothetical protein